MLRARKHRQIRRLGNPNPMDDVPDPDSAKSRENSLIVFLLTRAILGLGQGKQQIHNICPINAYVSMHAPSTHLSSLRVHFEVTSISFRFHFDLTSISLRCHSGFTSMSLRFHFGFDSVSLRFNLDVTSISLQREKETIASQGKGKPTGPKGNREATKPLF